MIDEIFFKFFLYSVFQLFQQLKCPDEYTYFFISQEFASLWNESIRKS